VHVLVVFFVVVAVVIFVNVLPWSLVVRVEFVVIVVAAGGVLVHLVGVLTICGAWNGVAGTVLVGSVLVRQW